MLKKIAIIFGIVMLLVGILGFVPQAFVDGKLLGLFAVDLIHNLVHVATGIVGLLCGLNGDCASRLFFKVFGIIYGIVTLAGFYFHEMPLFGIMANNGADNLLHLAITAFALYFGFLFKGCKRCCQCNEKSCHCDEEDKREP